MRHYDNARITFHGGNAFGPEGVDVKPFAIFTINTLVTDEVLQGIIKTLKDYVNTTHGDCCHVKMSTQDWDY